ncbi:hypothetical protein FGO68_gene146 [Halteria grandinella]|uniref:Uncharacterized protein n=1 Tax=Halteria grandinella TaxID=5974 RepID=A0A8J8NMS7_HALGN|nr:hypothetical protein FGO68_gene146 [Halteria grandinella]
MGDGHKVEQDTSRREKVRVFISFILIIDFIRKNWRAFSRASILLMSKSLSRVRNQVTKKSRDSRYQA